MSKLTFLQLAQKVLAESTRPMSVDDIWAYAQEKGYVEHLATLGKTPSATLGAQLYVQVKQGDDSLFATVGVRPKRFYLKSMAATINLGVVEPKKAEKEVVSKSATYAEKDLHSFVAYFAHLYLHTYCKTLNHSKSDKTQYAEWLHPDMVGCYFPMEDWEDSAIELSGALGVTNIRLYSFELKKSLTFSNLRESFFQAVSNSSWAHEGYLCAANISAEDEFQVELKRLSGSFGIGIIKIDVEDPDSTEVLYPARYRESLDWDGINKLCVNKDFRDFISRVRVDFGSKEIRKEKYDQVVDSARLKESISSSRT
jgi:hypothetical protein